MSFKKRNPWGWDSSDLLFPLCGVYILLHQGFGCWHGGPGNWLWVFPMQCSIFKRLLGTPSWDTLHTETSRNVRWNFPRWPAAPVWYFWVADALGLAESPYFVLALPFTAASSPVNITNFLDHQGPPFTRAVEAKVLGIFPENYIN